MKMMRQKREGKKGCIGTEVEGQREVTESREADGSGLLFQANFMGSNQSTDPDTDGAAAICWEISPLIGHMEKRKKRPPPARCDSL